MEKQQYDDFAINPNMFETMAKEYKLQQKNILSLNVKTNQTDNAIDKESLLKLFDEIKQLQSLLYNLMSLTTNNDIKQVVNDIIAEVEIENQNLLNTFENLNISKTMASDEIEKKKIFCNLLKSVVNKTSEIIKLLVAIKDSDTLFQYSTILTFSTNQFLDINTKLVSLFGDCRYRTFSLFR